MIKKIISVAFVAAVLSVGTYSYTHQHEKSLNSLSLENIEALADGEGSVDCRWASREISTGTQEICIDHGTGYSCICGQVKVY